MGADSGARIEAVSGGSHDPVVRGAAELAADHAGALALADLYDRTGDRMREWARSGASVLADADLIASSALSPATFAAAEVAILAATTGPDGTLAASAGWEFDARAIRGVIAAFERRDALTHQWLELVDYELGRLVGTTLPIAALAATPFLASPTSGELSQQVGDAGLEWLNQHSDARRHLLNGSGGVLDGLTRATPFAHLTPQDTAAAVAPLLGPEGPAQVSRYDAPHPVNPTSVADLVSNLSALNGSTGAPQPDGAISLQRLTDDAGATRWIVYAPGTDQTDPLHGGDAVRDLSAIARNVAGLPSTYGEGITRAMRSAGVGADEPVLVVGHSLGGMTAVNLLQQHHGYAITNVVTLGSPIAGHEIPADVQVLSLENADDVIPQILGERNSPAPNHVSVEFSEPATGFEHGLSHYLAGAEAVDRSHEPGLVEQRAALQGFLNVRDSSTQGFVITR